MWAVTRVGKTWQVTLDGILLYAGFPTSDAALRYVTSEGYEVEGCDVRSRAVMAEG